MRVLQIIQRVQLRGAEVFACHLSNELKAQGHIVKLVALRNGSAELPWQEPVGSIDANLSRRFWDVPAWKRLRSEIAEFKPDVIQANSGDTLKYAVMCKLIFSIRTPLIFRNASMVSLYIKSEPVRLLNAFFYSRTDQIISVSHASMKDFIRVFPGTSSRISMIPIGIQTEAAPAVTGKEPFTIIHIGGFSFEKNHKGLLRIFRRVKQNIPSARLLLVGDGPLRTKIEQSVRETGENGVYFTGAIKDPKPLLEASSVLVLPSLVEGLPSVILEAFLARVPVVAYDVGGIAELVRNGETGVLIAAGDEARFSEAVARILTGLDGADEMTVTARELVTAEYSIGAVARRFSDQYRELCASDPGNSR